jgi:hypothetical protein
MIEHEIAEKASRGIFTQVVLAFLGGCMYGKTQG